MLAILSSPVQRAKSTGCVTDALNRALFSLYLTSPAVRTNNPSKRTLKMTSFALASPVGLAPSIRKTLVNTFWTVGAMFALTAGTSLFTMGLKLGLIATLVCFVGSIALIFATHYFRNSALGLAMLAAFAALQGITLGPLLSHYLAMSNGPGVVGMAAGLTAVATLSCAAYAITTRRDFSRLRGFLFAGLIVVILGSLAGIFIQVPAFHLVLGVVGALLFTGWILFDVSSIVRGEETNYISASLGVFLNVLNLFTSLLRVLGLLGGDD